MTRLILASSSPRRKEILHDLGIKFDIIVPNVDELTTSDNPRKLAAYNAQIKCDAIAKNYNDRFILAADTIVTLDGIIFNKPLNLEDAYNMLLKLSGHTHQVITAISLKNIEKNIVENHAVVSEVTFKNFDRSTVEKYFSIVNPLDKSGSYAIQQAKDMIATNFTGEISNIMGLPKTFTYNLLLSVGFFDKHI